MDKGKYPIGYIPFRTSLESCNTLYYIHPWFEISIDQVSVFSENRVPQTPMFIIMFPII